MLLWCWKVSWQGTATVPSWEESVSSLDSPLRCNSVLDSSQVWSAATPLHCTFSVYEGCCYRRCSNLAIRGISLHCCHIAVWRAATWIFLTGNLTLHTQTMYIHSISVACHPAHLLGWLFACFKSHLDRGVGAKKMWIKKGSLHNAAGRASSARTSSFVAAIAARCLPTAGYNCWHLRTKKRIHEAEKRREEFSG